MKHYGDITKLSGYDLPIVDVITGGSPCQDLSVAKGGRTGFEGERSGLFFDQLRIVKEMREHDRATGRPDYLTRPRYMVWENVPGALSSGKPKGADFQIALTEIIRIAEPKAPDVPMPKDGRWAKAGCLYDEMGRWSVAWRLHDAQFWGVPQRRKRIALVADYGGLSASEVLFERKGLHWYPSESREEGERTSEGVEGGIGGTSVIENEPIMIEMTSTKNTIIQDGISSTLTARMGTGGNQVNAVLVKGVGNGQLHKVNVTDTVGALNCMHDQQMLLIGEGQNARVRRLTVKECTRLQGYPDGWLDIGDWVDKKGKVHKEANSPKYRAIGNSIALPFWFYLLRRISAQYERPATLGSLFDGIGGFPLCWERCNGKGTAIWASEIEEFPMAVTKYHFPEE